MRSNRVKLGISQTELAQKVGVHIETVANWEHSRSMPAICHLPKLIDFLGYDPFETPYTP